MALTKHKKNLLLSFSFGKSFAIVTAKTTSTATSTGIKVAKNEDQKTLNQQKN